MIALLRQFNRLCTALFGGGTTLEAAPEPTNWCLVGNIVTEHSFAEAQEVRRGSKHFRPGTKVRDFSQTDEVAH